MSYSSITRKTITQCLRDYNDKHLHERFELYYNFSERYFKYFLNPITYEIDPRCLENLRVAALEKGKVDAVYVLTKFFIEHGQYTEALNMFNKNAARFDKIKLVKNKKIKPKRAKNILTIHSIERLVTDNCYDKELCKIKPELVSDETIITTDNETVTATTICPTKSVWSPIDEVLCNHSVGCTVSTYLYIS